MAPNNKNIKRSQQQHRHQHTRKSREAKRHYGCGICQADHRLTSCQKFRELNLAEKYKTAVKLHYCVNCLARNHLVGKCTSKARCQKCSGKHHSVLHGPNRILADFATEKSNPPKRTRNHPPISAPRSALTASTSATASVGLPTCLNKVIVPTTEVYVMTEDGAVLVRGVLNPSSTTSRVAHSFVEEHFLTTFYVDGKKYTKLSITPNMSSTTKFDVYLLVVRDLPKKPYTEAMTESVKEKFENLALADPHFYANTSVEIELGGDLYTKILKSNMIRVDGGSLLAQDSLLGWLIMGCFSN